MVMKRSITFTLAASLVLVIVAAGAATASAAAGSHPAQLRDPRNHELFDLLGIAPSVCATTSIMRLIEHELPDHELVPLLELRREAPSSNTSVAASSQ